jgi:hypothetical protein
MATSCEHVNPGQPDPKGAESQQMYHWQGAVDARLDEHSRRLDTINGDAKAARQGTENIVVQLAVLKTKVAIWASLGGIGGAGIVSLAIQLLVK